MVQSLLNLVLRVESLRRRLDEVEIEEAEDRTALDEGLDAALGQLREYSELTDESLDEVVQSEIQHTMRDLQVALRRWQIHLDTAGHEATLYGEIRDLSDEVTGNLVKTGNRV